MPGLDMALQVFFSSCFEVANTARIKLLLDGVNVPYMGLEVMLGVEEPIIFAKLTLVLPHLEMGALNVRDQVASCRRFKVAGPAAEWP